MSKIFNLAVRMAKMIGSAETTVLKTDTEILYRIPRVFPEGNGRMEVHVEEDYVTLILARKPEIGKLIPVAPSPLDAYRGRGPKTS